MSISFARLVTLATVAGVWFSLCLVYATYPALVGAVVILWAGVKIGRAQ